MTQSWKTTKKILRSRLMVLIYMCTTLLAPDYTGVLYGQMNSMNMMQIKVESTKFVCHWPIRCLWRDTLKLKHKSNLQVSSIGIRRQPKKVKKSTQQKNKRKLRMNLVLLKAISHQSEGESTVSTSKLLRLSSSKTTKENRKRCTRLRRISCKATFSG